MAAKINPNGKLKGQVAVVTGASRGIGEAISVRLAMERREGHILGAHPRRKATANCRARSPDTVERIKKAGGRSGRFVKGRSFAAERNAKI